MDTFRIDLEQEIQTILSGNFRVVVQKTDTVPSVDDPDITYPNIDTGEQKCKLLESCILHVDIRDSTKIGEKHRRETLVRLYSAFVRAMSRCAAFCGGRVRNIVGDRVMVLFDQADCFSSAVHTAILMHSVVNYLIDEHFTLNDIECGIGIDYGPMLIAKAGVVKRGAEHSASRQLVWLGQPANVASKLADEANKFQSWTTPTVCEGYHYQYIKEWHWQKIPIEDFVNKLQKTFSPTIKHPDQNFSTFFRSRDHHWRSWPAILMTQSVYDGFKSSNPNDESFTKKLWSEQSLKVSGYNGVIYGGDVIFTSFQRSMA